MAKFARKPLNKREGEYPYYDDHDLACLEGRDRRLVEYGSRVAVIARTVGGGLKKLPKLIGHNAFSQEP